MPPFLPRKRFNSTPPASSRPTPAKKAKLADVLDAESRNIPGLDQTKTFSLGSDDSDSSLSDIDSDEFEDVPASVKQPSAPTREEYDEEDEDIEWEDAGGQKEAETPTHMPLADGPIELVFRKDDNEIEYGAADAAKIGKKGPTKREKEARVMTHQLHVQFLLWHNSIRNRWISDKEVQQTLVQQLPPQIRKEVDKWKRACGLSASKPEVKAKADTSKRRGKQTAIDPRTERDWGRPSQRLEKGKPDMSNGDPLISLLKVLAAYWKKRFAVTAPGLRKRGYGTKQALKQIIYSLRNDEHDHEEHGERIRNIQEFRELARKCEGSRDVGAQLFTALLRGLGIEARLVASLQPSGFGWTKVEQMLPRKPAKPVDIDSSTDDSELDDVKSISEITKQPPARKGTPGRKGIKPDPGRDPSSGVDEDDDSVVDITPSMPKKRPQKYDRDHPFPIYWSEAISPITNKILPVSPLVLATPVASTAEILSTFEPRGVKAENTRTVMAYVIAYSSDGTAKDVTVRYLKKQIWPGKTKGFRFPVEKIPIYNKYGKVKRYEEYDWFKRVLSGYIRPDLMRTAVDDIEDSSDLVPQLPEKKEVDESIDTLQSLKSSADWVLERFLRREEALRPGAKPVRIFVSGKGDNIKEEPVFRRADVERCLTAESWHKEGRRPKAGEAPRKFVAVRAVTLTRKREAEEHERMTGEKQMQGLYSWDQTEYIIPPPIKNGIIPKNAYGNIDCFVPSMVPKGAVHIPLRGTVRICKKLDVDFAEAVTGFEFGNKRAVPVCQGVVVAIENEKAVVEAWTKFNEEQRKKEEGKMEKLVLDLWRKFVMGLRIRERVQDTYGDVVNDQPNLNRGDSKDQPINIDDEEDMPGAALPEHEDDFGGGFLLDDEEPAVPEDLEMVHHEDFPETNKSKRKNPAAEYPTPSSVSPLEPMQRQRKGLIVQAADRGSSELSLAMSDDYVLSKAETEESQSVESEGEENVSVSISNSKNNVEVSIRGTRLRCSRGQPSRPSGLERDEDDETLEGLEASSWSESSDEDDEDDYKPVRLGAHTSRTQKGIRKQLTPARRTRNRGKKVTVEEAEHEDEIVTLGSKRSSRRVRTEREAVTSPYFKS